MIDDVAASVLYVFGYTVRVVEVVDCVDGGYIVYDIALNVTVVTVYFVYTIILSN